MRYRVYRSVNSKSAHPIFLDGRLDDLSDKVRHREPWRARARSENHEDPLTVFVPRRALMDECRVNIAFSPRSVAP